MIKPIKQGNRLLLNYRADQTNDARWLDDKLRNDGGVTLRRTFTFTSKEMLTQAAASDEAGDDERVFTLGVLENGYYKISKDILGLKYDLFLHEKTKIEPKTFVAYRDISIFRKIDELIDEPIIVGGESEQAIPLNDFDLLLRTFPTSTELTHYAGTRIARILKDYFRTISDAEKKLNQHLNRRKKLPVESRESIVSNFELQKFEYVHAELESMLADVDSYTEKDWQTKIIGLLLFVFPKYIAVLENVHIKDFYTNAGKATDRYIDLMLVDANGAIDLIEVKKPFSNALVSSSTYRDNHTPKKELAGSVMQAEKYLFHLNKWGHAGEKEIYHKRKAELPSEIELKITNPKAMILLGRDYDFVGQQRFDFEIIRRKYANMLDIMTYDDLLRRVANIIEMMKRHGSNRGAQ
ncbi:Shedu immune nuclease family protein [Thermithiobacillus plumbiphilus]|uniref:Shedu immune nuclease family protein n=1 Tax=Thermithiobacillus plumbiphilus TaxID=1729899 RepID=A0ABU9D5C3_9PROT